MDTVTLLDQKKILESHIYWTVWAATQAGFMPFVPVLNTDTTGVGRRNRSVKSG